MKTLKLFITGGFILLSFWAKAQILSEQAQISILTCEQGNEIYSLFGHSAIRVLDEERNIDEVYNYGTFDGFEDNFELKFAKGQLDYSLSKQTLEGFLYEYQYYNRSVWEQILNIPQNKKQEIYNFLLENNLPENRKYRYDFFYDNCATRLRDILENILGDELSFGKHQWHNQFTFRQIIDKDLIKTPYTHFGIDLVLGQRIDVKASSYDLMFHPIYLQEVLEKSQRNGQPLVSKTNIIHQATEKAEFKEDKTLIYIMWCIFIIGALLTMFRVDGLGKLLDTLISYILALLGVFLIIMWFGTDHPATKYNWNILWANPLLLYLPFAIKQKHKNYFRAMLAIYFLTTVGAFILPQELAPASIPLILYLALRHFYYFRNLKYKA